MLDINGRNITKVENSERVSMQLEPGHRHLLLILERQEYFLPNAGLCGSGKSSLQV